MPKLQAKIKFVRSPNSQSQGVGSSSRWIKPRFNLLDRPRPPPATPPGQIFLCPGGSLALSFLLEQDSRSLRRHLRYRTVCDRSTPSVPPEVVGLFETDDANVHDIFPDLFVMDVIAEWPAALIKITSQSSRIALQSTFSPKCYNLLLNKQKPVSGTHTSSHAILL